MEPPGRYRCDRSRRWSASSRKPQPHRPTANAFDFLSTHYFDPENGFDQPADPFSQEYREWAHELWSRLSGRREQYDPAAHELSGYEEEVDTRSPPPYNIGSGHLLGEILICWGFLLRTLDLKPGQSVLEYGPGSGQILLQFARMGVRAAGIDIDPVQTRFIQEQGERLGLDIRRESRGVRRHGRAR